MDYQEIIYTKKDRIATVTFNRPKQLNALTNLMREEVLDATKDASADDSVRVVVFKGAGKAFCAGADLSQSPRVSGKKTDAPVPNSNLPRDGFQEAFARVMWDMPKPAVASINGATAGLGFGIALCCDLRIASTQGKFAAAFSRISLVPEACMTFYLPRIVGLARAADILYTGRQIKAEEAVTMGLVNQAVSPETLDDTVDALAETLANAAPIAIALTRRELYRGLEGTFSGQLEMEMFHQKFAGRTQDAREGPRAFMEKRAPDFQGR
ncbi:MAG: 2-(1,2-epoxy-1,2-dihydrophenyl)acetyl-CoA isomerase [Candidatus Azotimanducaceae bacterium]|jgi:2-(1,2-epoxy-1,2-dihydrophenyl)acetyl-CoA isomerase